MKSLKFFLFNNFLPIILFIFSILICQYTGNRGVYPIDSFAHFDSGFRVLKGEHPFKDYWVVSGPIIDYFQSIIFYIFGTSWQSYLLNSSILNGIISLSTFYLFINLGLNKSLSFFYSICFAILAYPSSGTPFVDHHSTFLSLLSLYALILAIITNKFIFWFSIPILILFGFLSKQVPAAYILITIILTLILYLPYCGKNNLIKIFKYLSVSSLSILCLIILFLKVNSIRLDDFITQYLLYPSTLGDQRYEKINYDLKNIFLDYKFIYISFFSLLFLTIKNLNLRKKLLNDKNFVILLISFLLFISLVQHMIVTKNQIFIFFLIPFFLGLAHLQLKSVNTNYKKYVSLFLILFCVGITMKYHLRYNIERKFHELNNINFSKSVKGQTINKKLTGLNWITPENSRKFKMNFEVELLNNFLKVLENDNSERIVITNYSIFSLLINEKLSGYSRWYPGDNSAFPVEGNRYFENYKNFIVTFLKKKKIKNIYVLPDVSELNLTNYLEKECFTRQEMKMKILKFIINQNCKQFTKIRLL